MTANTIITGSKLYAQKQETIYAHQYTAEAAQYTFIMRYRGIDIQTKYLHILCIHTERVKNPKLV